MGLQKLSNSVIRRAIQMVRVTIIVLCLVSGVAVLALLNTNMMKSNASQVQLYKAEIDAVMAEKVAFINTVATGVSSGAAKQGYYAYVDEMVKQFEDVSAVYVCVEEKGVVYSDGIMTYMSGGWVPDADFVVSERSWYKGAMETDEVYVSDPYVDEQSGNICITLSKKVYEDEKVIGTAGLDMYLDDLVNLIKSSYQNGNYVFLVAKDDTILTHPNEKMALSVTQSTKFADALDGKYSKACQKKLTNKMISDYSGGLKFVIGEESDVTGWKIVAVNSAMQIFMIVLGIILTAVVAAIVIERLTKIALMKTVSPLFEPLEELSANVHRIADGELDYSFSVDQKSEEVHVLSTELNETIGSLKQCITEITDTVTAISEKNLDFTVEGTFHGDYAKIKDALVDIVAVLNDSFLDVKKQASTVLDYSENLSETSENVAQAATEQSEAVLAASDEMKNLTGNMEKISEFAALIKDNINSTNKQLNIGQQEMKNLVAAMDEIAACYAEIAGFITEINAIADQTSLLALNASIEAARSGEAGKGFAVVATEIGKLANNSTEASQKISDTINRSLQSVEKGKTLVNTTDTTISESVSYSLENTKMAEEIAGFVKTQKQSADEIFGKLKNIAEIVESNAASAQENSAISVSMGECAGELMETISRFQLRE